ncbi:MAG: hypothetical protein IT445_17765 [Phycisphaeraceae bacterium]|nr:hypothetical protein [Phycisphaeraceae bacterium]
MIKLREINPLRPDFPGRMRSYFNGLLKTPASWLARAHRSTLGRNATLIAVTGSFGKTTTTRAIAAILGQHTRRENFENCFAGLYLRAMYHTSAHDIAVMEVGIGRPGQMTRYARVLRPNIAVVTAVGLEHDKTIPGGIETIGREKAELVVHLPPQAVAVLNADDPIVAAMAERTRARVLTFGRAPQADVALLDVQHEGGRSMKLRLRVAGREHDLHTQLVSSISVSPLLAAVAATHAAGIDAADACRAIESLTPTPRRLESATAPCGATVLVDEYKGTPATAHAAFDAAGELANPRKLALLGNIPQSTPEPKEPILRALGQHAGQVFDRVLLIHLSDEHYQWYSQGLMTGGLDASCITRVSDVFEAAEVLRSQLKADDLLLLKGHFFDHLTRVVLMLQDKPVRCGLKFCLIRGSDWCDKCPHVLRDKR